MQAVSCIVLAGGKSARLKTDKAFLEVDGQRLIERVVERVATIGDEVLLVTNSPEEFAYLGLSVVRDVQPGQGTLGGLYSGLLAARNEYGLVVACDMPFLDLRLLRYMILLAPGQDVVIPRIGDMLEPLHAIYSRNCLGSIERVLARGGRRVIEFFPDVRVRYVDQQEVDILDPMHLSFFNINTPEDLDRARKLTGGNL
ncbi:MAG: molybdenum cofactor guanylyltransferase [Chloroflexota bacterium]|nr:molybdenum cofactor guanylyltransferase [Chloroflexota bacterium]